MYSEERLFYSVKVRWALLILVVISTFFVAYRAAIIPFTHDESSTWLNFRFYNVLNCLYDYYCWQTANNHWLNTLLLQGSAAVFGESPLALRLPNVIAGAFYFIAAALMAHRYVKGSAMQIAAFLLLSGHLYLLDFFSLARGYGLMACGILWSVYALLRYLEQYSLRWLLCCIVALVLAVLSNFVALLCFVSVGVVWFFWMVSQKQFRLLFWHGSMWVLFSLMLAYLTYYPIKILRGSGEFEWGEKNVVMTLHDLMRNLLYGELPFGQNSRSILMWIVLGGILLVGFGVIRNKTFTARTQVVCLLALIVMNSVGIVCLQYFTGSYSPVGRKAIYLLPFLFAPLALGLNLVSVRRLATGLSVVVSVALILSVVRPSLWASTREWYYDAHYPELFSTILPDNSSADSVSLGTSWVFYPSLSYYQQAQSVHVSGLVYQKPLIPDSTHQYYFIELGDTTGLVGLGYALEKKIGPFLLYKNTSFYPVRNDSIPLQ